MMRIQMLGHLGKDAIIQQHGTESVINWSMAHTDKWKDASGKQYERTTWVSCSWWTESLKVAEYLKKGTLIWAEGVPEAKNWKDKNGESKAFLNMRVARVELLGGKREDQSTPANTNENTSSGYQPVNTGAAGIDDEQLPF